MAKATEYAEDAHETTRAVQSPKQVQPVSWFLRYFLLPNCCITWFNIMHSGPWLSAHWVGDDGNWHKLLNAGIAYQELLTAVKALIDMAKLNALPSPLHTHGKVQSRLAATEADVVKTSQTAATNALGEIKDVGEYVQGHCVRILLAIDANTRVVFEHIGDDWMGHNTTGSSQRDAFNHIQDIWKVYTRRELSPADFFPTPHHVSSYERVALGK